MGRRPRASVFHGDRKACTGGFVWFELGGSKVRVIPFKTCLAFGHLRKNFWMSLRNLSVGVLKIDRPKGGAVDVVTPGRRTETTEMLQRLDLL